MADRIDDNTGYDLSFRGTIMTNPSVNITSRKKPLTFFVSDGTGRIKLTFFNSPYLSGKFSVGDECFIHGSVTLFNGQMQMVNPYIEKAEKITDDALVRPVYHLTAGLTSNNISKWAATALKLCGDELLSCIPASIAEQKGFVSPKEAYMMAHLMGGVSGNILDIIRLDYGKTEERIKRENPYIEDIRVSVKLPSTVDVQVKERMKVCYIRTPDGYAALDKDGIVLELTSFDAKKSVRPVICGLNVTYAELGKQVKISNMNDYKKAIIVLGAILAADNASIGDTYSMFENTSA